VFVSHYKPIFSTIIIAKLPQPVNPASNPTIKVSYSMALAGVLYSLSLSDMIRWL